MTLSAGTAAEADNRCSYGDLTLHGGSPAGNSGNNAYLSADEFDADIGGDTEDVILVDLTGSTMIMSSTVDMEAFESL